MTPKQVQAFRDEVRVIVGNVLTWPQSLRVTGKIMDALEDVLSGKV